MKGPGKGQGKPGRGKGKGKGKGKDKGKGKGSGAGVGSTYANPGRPKSFQPTQQDRQRTGNIAEYFRRREHTPRPVAPVFASAQMRGGLEGSRPRASRAADVTVAGHSTKVLDVHAAPAPAAAVFRKKACKKLIEKLETMIQKKKKRAKSVRTSWSLEDKRTVLAVFKVLNRE